MPKLMGAALVSVAVGSVITSVPVAAFSDGGILTAPSLVIPIAFVAFLAIVPLIIFILVPISIFVKPDVSKSWETMVLTVLAGAVSGFILYPAISSLSLLFSEMRETIVGDIVKIVLFLGPIGGIYGGVFAAAYVGLHWRGKVKGTPGGYVGEAK